MNLTFSHSDLRTLVDGLGRRLGDMKPAFERIRREILGPLVEPAWAASGIVSRSGGLRRAILPWHRARSAGVKLNGRKKNPVFAKADVLQKGRRAHQHKKRDTYTVKSRKGKTFERKNTGSPWGDIRPRVFMPQPRLLRAHRRRIERILAEHLRRNA